jgi:ribosome-associated heat shock protein Hsp15
MRLDQWLWHARFYRTRGLAADAVKAGHVKVEGQRCKPAKEIEPGAELTIGKGEETWSVTVAALPARRGPAAEARECYVEDLASIAQRAQHRRDRRLAAYEPPTPGRPDKRTRRMIRVQRGRS